MGLLDAIRRASRTFVQEMRNSKRAYVAGGVQLSCRHCGHRRFERTRTDARPVKLVTLACVHCGCCATFRDKQLTELTPGHCPKCEYDLRGTLAAGNVICPECGTPVPEDFREG